jgi:hypothetical protein
MPANEIYISAPDIFLVGMLEPSIFLAVFPYAFMAAFPVFGIAIVTKWELDRKRRKKNLTHIST